VSLFAAARRVCFMLALVGAMLANSAAPAAAASQFETVSAIARAQIGDRFLLGADGPNRFDCSGLVYFTYSHAGLLDRIGGQRLASGYYRWFHKQGRTSRSNPRPGDLIVWGHHGAVEHVGIYLGSGYAISALVNPWGVKVHPVKGWINMPFIAYLHVGLDR
jgi:cell wall-associated NlpC family hydrolase